MSNYVLESPGVYRCKGCGHGVRTTDPDSIRGCLCSKLGECIYLGEPTKETATCKGCSGSPAVHTIFTCNLPEIGKCLPFVRKGKKTTPEIHKCDGCQSRVANSDQDQN